MRISTVVAGSAVAAALAASLTGVAAPAGAATSTHLATARADWQKGAKVAAANENRYWLAARQQLAAYGNRYFHERDVLTALTKIPLTDTTAAQRAEATRATRELNGFFHTSGLYGVSTGNARAIARTYWIRSAHVSAAESGAWFAATRDELDSYGSRFRTETTELTSLQAIPLTDTTPKQRAEAQRDVHGLDTFFDTPGLHD